MKLAAMAPAYLPPLSYFWKMAQAERVIITDHFQYVKRSSLSVSAALDENGLQLRIPVLHDKRPVPILEKKTDRATPWPGKHFRSISHLFHDAPYAYHYLPQMEELLSKAASNLSDFLYGWLDSFLRWLQLPVKTERASEVGSKDTNEESILFWCEKYGCREYIADAGVYYKGWVKPDILAKKKIKCREFAPMPEAHILATYKDLSVINFLLQFGPEAGYLIRQYLSY